MPIMQDAAIRISRAHIHLSGDVGVAMRWASFLM
jgi:hypothetical protein